MNRLSLLKTFTAILQVTGKLILFFFCPFVLFIAIFPEKGPSKLYEVFEPLTAIEIAMLIILFLGFALFVHALSLFRKLLSLFSQKILFDDGVVKNLDHIGKAVIAGYITIATITCLDDIFAEEKPSILLGIILSCIFLGTGLFFLVLSSVFRSAKMIKEENDLTL